jgi:ATP-binding cassette subfamily B protein
MKRLHKNAIVHLAATLWRYSKGQRGKVVTYSLMSMVAMALCLVPPLVIGKLLKVVQESSIDEVLSKSFTLIAIFVALQATFWAFHGPSRVIETVNSFAVRRAFQGTLFRKVTALPTRWHKAHHSGETIDQVAKATTALGEFAECGFEVISIVTRFIGGLAMLTWVMPWTGPAMLVLIGIALTVVVLFDRVLIKQYEGYNKRMNGVAAAIQDYLTNVATVISLRLEKRVAVEVDRRTEAVAPLWKKNCITNELKWFVMEMIIRSAHGAVLLGYIATAVHSSKVIEIGALYMLHEYLRGIADSMFHFTFKYGDLVAKSTKVRAIEHIEEAFEREVEAVERAQLPQGWRTVEISALTFSHNEEVDDPAATPGLSPGVRGISLNLERGKSYALVGESGSGKSTTLKLLRGLLTPSAVTVKCDGVYLPCGIAHVAHHTTLIPQDPEIFADTIRFNVSMGIEVSDENIETAIIGARFAQVLKRLPRGLDTHIAEKGVSLSGGEKQRLAVARGLFFVTESGSDIVLLDEPTSSVDTANERMIYTGLLREFKKHCVLTAIHKFHLLHLFDEVLVFANGEIVERGSLDQLLQMDGEFLRLWNTYTEAQDETQEAV